jgi:hypothetical protein
MNLGMRKAKQTLAQQAAGGVNALRDLASELAEVFQAISEGRPPRIEELAMADVVGFFVDHRDSVPEAEAAAIVRDQAKAGAPQEADGVEYTVHLFFLDCEGRPLIKGNQPKRSYLTRRFDAELAGAFGANDIIIFN